MSYTTQPWRAQPKNGINILSCYKYKSEMNSVVALLTNGSEGIMKADQSKVRGKITQCSSLLSLLSLAV